MKITINTDRDVEEISVDITCKSLTPEIEKVIATLRMIEKQLTGKKDGQIFLISVRDVVYIESVERKCFLYTREAYYETDFKLYELEEQLKDRGFFRISKSVLINLREVRSLKTELNRRLRVTMHNGEQIIASRQYADELKKELGL